MYTCIYIYIHFCYRWKAAKLFDFDPTVVPLKNVIGCFLGLPISEATSYFPQTLACKSAGKQPKQDRTVKQWRLRCGCIFDLGPKSIVSLPLPKLVISKGSLRLKLALQPSLCQQSTLGKGFGSCGNDGQVPPAQTFSSANGNTCRHQP